MLFLLGLAKDVWYGCHKVLGREKEEEEQYGTTTTQLYNFTDGPNSACEGKKVKKKYIKSSQMLSCSFSKQWGKYPNQFI